MFGIGETEFVIILVFAFLILGPEKLPEAGRTLGRVLRQAKDAQDSLTKTVHDEIAAPLKREIDIITQPRDVSTSITNLSKAAITTQAHKDDHEAADIDKEAADIDKEVAQGASTDVAGDSVAPDAAIDSGFETFAQRKARLLNQARAHDQDKTHPMPQAHDAATLWGISNHTHTGEGDAERP